MTINTIYDLCLQSVNWYLEKYISFAKGKDRISVQTQSNTEAGFQKGIHNLKLRPIEIRLLLLLLFIYLFIYLFIMKSYTRYTIKIKVKSKILSIQRHNNINF